MRRGPTVHPNARAAFVIPAHHPGENLGDALLSPRWKPRRNPFVTPAKAGVHPFLVLDVASGEACYGDNGHGTFGREAPTCAEARTGSRGAHIPGLAVAILRTAPAWKDG